MSSFGVEWAPLKVPFERRLQTGAVMLFCWQVTNQSRYLFDITFTLKKIIEIIQLN